MRSAFHIEIPTPDKLILNGLWFGPKKPKKLIIFIHGLTGSAFSMKRVVDAMVTKDTAVITFNNRGFEQVTSVKRAIGKKTTYVSAGTAHEVFIDSKYDIEGAVRFAQKMGVKHSYLAGHSTGCQKAIYWAAQGGKGIRGIILFGPLSDYSGALMSKGKRVLERGVAVARKRIAADKAHELMPKRYIEWFLCDAQRYVSLYSQHSKEEIFTYARPEVEPKTLQKNSYPTLVLLAGADEYGDRAPNEIAAWFQNSVRGPHKVVIVPKVGHGFKGGERVVSKWVKAFMK